MSEILLKSAVINILKEDRVFVKYRPSWREITGSVTATILLQQVKFHWDNMGEKPFYKFMQPAPDHKAYKDGDSWCEELGFTISELRTALDKIGKRLNKDEVKNLNESLKESFFGYFTDQQHLTWFYFNEDYFNEIIITHYAKEKFPNQDSYFPNQDSLFGEIRNPELAKSGILSSILAEILQRQPETTTAKNEKIDFTDDSRKISDLEKWFGPQTTTASAAVGDSHRREFTPDRELQLLLEYGRTSPANPAINEAEQRLISSGWDIRNSNIRKACVLLLANTPMSIPQTDKGRKRWSVGLKEHLRFGLDKLPDLYQRAYAKLYQNEFYPGNPDGLTATMTGLNDADNYQPQRNVSVVRRDKPIEVSPEDLV